MGSWAVVGGTEVDGRGRETVVGVAPVQKTRSGVLVRVRVSAVMESRIVMHHSDIYGNVL